MREELKKIIVEELKGYPYCKENIRNQIADNIISKLPKEEVVASGEVGFCINGYTLNGKLLTDLIDKLMSKKIYKSIQLVIREVKQ